MMLVALPVELGFLTSVSLDWAKPFTGRDLDLLILVGFGFSSFFPVEFWAAVNRREHWQY